MNWKASQLFWKLQSQPFSNCVLWHVPRSFIEGNMSSLPETLGKLCTVSPLRLHSSVGEAFWSLAVQIFDYLSLSHCFLNLFNHRLAFFFFWQGTPIHISLVVVFLWNSVLDILPQFIFLSLKYGSWDPAQQQILRTLSSFHHFFFHANFLKFAPMSYRVIDLTG